MSVLHDGENYLIEQYDLALTPGLQLLESASDLAEFNTLTGGLTQARQGFPPLPAVRQELEQIKKLVRAQILIDDRFTRTDFQTQIDQEPFSSIHLATHGQFSSLVISLSICNCSLHNKKSESKICFASLY